MALKAFYIALYAVEGKLAENTCGFSMRNLEIRTEPGVDTIGKCNSETNCFDWETAVCSAIEFAPPSVQSMVA